MVMKKERKKELYYVDGYVYKVPLWMSEKEAKKKYGIVFKDFEHAQNFRIAGIFAG